MLSQAQYSYEEAGSASRPIRALHLDDNEFDRTRVRRLIRKTNLPAQVEEAPTIEAMSGAMEKDRFDLFLIDYHLPDSDGLRAVEFIRNHAKSKDAAVIMITGRKQQQIAVSAFRQGCHDLITKEELSPVLLRERMQTALQRVRYTARRDLFEEEQFQRQLQNAVQASFEGDAMQAVITEGFRRAVRSSCLPPKFDELQKMEQFLADFLKQDDFSFKS